MSKLFEDGNYCINVLVKGEVEELVFDIPIYFDLEEVGNLLNADLIPIGEVDPEDTLCFDKDSLEECAGALTWGDFDIWRDRVRDMQTIACVESELERANLDYYDSFQDLDENIATGLRNAMLFADDYKGGFRARRELCGASQAMLADALEVNARTVKRWETLGDLEIPMDASRLIEAWGHDVRDGAAAHLDRARKCRDGLSPQAYRLIIWRNQEEFDAVLKPLLEEAPAHGWRASLADAKAGVEREVDYTDRPGVRGYWRANAAAKMASILMDAEGIGYGFSYIDEADLFEDFYVWVPCVDVERIPGGEGQRPLIVCGMR